jgi:polar amino acid transport system substrate-binding protein
MPLMPPTRSARRRLLRWAVVAMTLLALLGSVNALGAAQAANPGPRPAVQGDGMTLRGGWYPWEPYQYLKKEGERRELTGLDVQLLREAIEGEIGQELELTQVSWSQHQQDLQSGRRDIAGGAFRTASRERYAYISKPYRFEEIALYHRKYDPRSEAVLQAKGDLSERLLNSSSRLGLVKGYYYGPQIEALIENPAMASRITWVDDHESNLHNLQQGEVDLVPVDRLVGATVVWQRKWGDQLATPQEPIFRGSIHALFSKASTDPQLVTRFDKAIAAMKADGRYSRIVRNYLFPILLSLTVGQDWFFALEVIGTVAFALSGVLLAHREDFSIFGAFVLALLPAVGGGLMRDLIINRDVPGVLRTPISLLLVIALVLVAYALIKMLPKLGRLPKRMNLQPLVDVLDAIALAAYTVVGVIVAVEARCEPLVLWGPLLSALTGAGGSVLRDVVRGDTQHPTLRRSLYAEIALGWGLVLSIFINHYAQASSYDPLPLLVAVLVTLFGALATRLLVMAKGFAAPRFR